MQTKSWPAENFASERSGAGTCSCNLETSISVTLYDPCKKRNVKKKTLILHSSKCGPFPLQLRHRFIRFRLKWIMSRNNLVKADVCIVMILRFTLFMNLSDYFWLYIYIFIYLSIYLCQEWPETLLKAFNVYETFFQHKEKLGYYTEKIIIFSFDFLETFCT